MHISLSFRVVLTPVVAANSSGDEDGKQRGEERPSLTCRPEGDESTPHQTDQ